MYHALTHISTPVYTHVYTCVLSFIGAITHRHPLKQLYTLRLTCIQVYSPSQTQCQTSNSTKLKFILFFFFSFFHHPCKIWMNGLLISFLFSSKARSTSQREHDVNSTMQMYSTVLYMCVPHIHFWMRSRVLNITGGKRHALLAAVQFWLCSVEISSSVAQCGGCGCRTLSGAIMRSWFQESPCGSKYMI